MPAMTARLRDAEPKVRQCALAALGNLGPAAAASVPALLATLGTSSRFLLAEEVEALGRIGDSPRQVVPALEAALQKPGDDSRARVAGTILRIAGGD